MQQNNSQWSNVMNLTENTLNCSYLSVLFLFILSFSCDNIISTILIFILLGFVFYFTLSHTPYVELLTLLSLGLLLTLLAELTEARFISTKFSRNNMFSKISIRGFPLDIA